MRLAKSSPEYARFARNFRAVHILANEWEVICNRGIPLICNQDTLSAAKPHMPQP